MVDGGMVVSWQGKTEGERRRRGGGGVSMD